MNYSAHYNLNLAEGTDLVNPLTVDVPNYTQIDNTMFANEQAGVGTGAHIEYYLKSLLKSFPKSKVICSG